MAYIQDSTQSFTISLTAFLEGLGRIVYMEVANLTQAISGVWDNGIWVSPVPPATEADSMMIYVDVINNGVVDDTIFTEFVSTQVTPAEALIQESLTIVGDWHTGQWTFIMPANDVNITINAGHVE